MEQLNIALEGLGVNLPYSIETEQAVLGTAILDSEAVPEIIENVDEEYFYSKQNRLIFREIYNLFQNNIRIDYITLLSAVIDAKVFADESEAKVYLAQLTDVVPSLTNVGQYADILRERYLIRALIESSYDIIKQTQGQDDAKNLIEYAEQKMYDLRQGKDVSGLKTIAKSTMETLDRLAKKSGPDREKYMGVATGYSDLDYKLGRLGKSDLIVLAARPGMGKTSFALNIATNVASKSKIPVAIFSLEMSDEQLTQRILSAEAGVDSRILRDGLDMGMDSNNKVRNRDDKWAKITTAANMIGEYPIVIDDTSDITVNDIKAKVRRYNKNSRGNNIGLIIVDYIQLMTTGGHSENRVQEIASITRNLKIMAKELDVPVLALSQLSRTGAKNAQGGSKKPQLTDLRDSGSIEQDADVVLFLHRESYYADNKESADDEYKSNSAETECIISKNRHGETGSIMLLWDAPHTKFYSTDYSHRDEQ